MTTIRISVSQASLDKCETIDFPFYFDVKKFIKNINDKKALSFNRSLDFWIFI